MTTTTQAAPPRWEAAIAVSGFAVGFVGDALLNVAVTRVRVFDAGLREYFPRHGALEAMFIAGGLVALTAFLAALLLGRVVALAPERDGEHVVRDIALRSAYFFAFGAVVDNFFRFGNLMGSLSGMYCALSPPVSMFFAGAPLVAAYWIALALFW